MDRLGGTEARLRSAGYRALMGVTSPLRELMLWSGAATLAGFSRNQGDDRAVPHAFEADSARRVGASA